MSSLSNAYCVSGAKNLWLLGVGAKALLWDAVAVLMERLRHADQAWPNGSGAIAMSAHHEVVVDHAHDGVEVGCVGTQRDEDVHVGGPPPQRLVCAHVEAPPHYELHTNGQL